jgi:hypothetical protein
MRATEEPGSSVRHRCSGPLTRPPSKALRNGDANPCSEPATSAEALK